MNRNKWRTVFKKAAAGLLAGSVVCTGLLAGAVSAADQVKTLHIADFVIGKGAADGGGTMTEENGAIVLSKRDYSDNHATSGFKVGVFTLEADTKILEGDGNPLLTFGVANRDDPPAARWYGAGPNRNGNPYGGEARLFGVNTGGLDAHTPMTEAQKKATSYKLKVSVDAEKVIRFYMDGQLVLEEKDENYMAGYIGILAWNAKVAFSNVKLTMGDPVAEEADFHTNLTNVKFRGGSWNETANGLLASGSGDCFAVSDNMPKDFIFETKAHVTGDAASLLFRSNESGSNAYVANVDRGQKNARIFKFTDHGAVTLGTYRLPDANKTDYSLRVEVVGARMNYFVDGVLAVSCEDDQFGTGRLGLLICNSTVTFQDAFYTEVESGISRLTGLALDGASLSPAFDQGVYSYTATVPYATGKLTVTPAFAGTVTASARHSGGTVTLAAKEVNGAFELPLLEGDNALLLRTKNEDAEGLTTVVQIKREQNPETYYTEKYRPQYHITPESNWLNDPNGMVYYHGKYHFFYQYNPDTKFPGDVKYWAHVVSDDLVHWENMPVALSPDQYGSMWSGSAVVDFDNSTGLFDDTPDKTGLVAYYTNTELGSIKQRQCMAYSKDEGLTWIKYNGGAPILDGSDDPLNDGAFRDPKVFWHEESGRWMMICAGGPVRFFSSENLIDWKPEGMQPELGTECADFYKLPVDGDDKNSKWVLSGAGVWYSIGDFEKVGGVWKFIPDSDERPGFNFAPDVYAGQTFSDIPGRRIMMEWMVNIGYPFQIGDLTDPWNGAVTLPYEIKLKTVDGKITLTQEPVEELSSLRTEKHSFADLAVGPDTPNPLQNLLLDKCEIVAEVDMGTASEIVFDLRVGNGQITSVKYNALSGLLTLDRSAAGKNPVDWFPGAYTKPVKLGNGKLRLHMFLDWSSLEVFCDGAVGTMLIYPDPGSVGMSLRASGGTATIERLDVYEQASIYREESGKKPELESFKVTGAAANYLEDELFTLWAIPDPVGAEGKVEWSVSNKRVLEIVSAGDQSVVLKGLRRGECTVTATAGGKSESMDVTVSRSGFKTNLENFTPIGGSWKVTEGGYQGASGGNGPTFSSSKAGDFTYEGDFTYKNGAVGAALIFRAADDLSVWYSADICEVNRNARIIKFHRDPSTGATRDETLGQPFTLTPNENHTYHLKVEAEGSSLRFYIDGQLAVETTDSESLSGRFGLNVCDVTGVFQNVYYESSDKPVRPDCKFELDAENGIVSGLDAGVTVADLIEGFGGGDWVRVTKDGAEVTGGLASTGMTVQYKDGEKESFTAAVSGDLTGDGKVNITDVMAVCKVLARKSTDIAPTALEKAAGDLTGEGDVTVTDVMALCKILASKA